MEITINQLRCFREVASQQQYTRAAEALFVSQPAVSRCIKHLERQVGAPLFEVTGRRVLPTAAGRLLLPHAERVLAELRAADRALAALSKGDEGRLVIGASSTPGTYLLPPLLGDFRRRFPKVEPSLEIADTGQVLESVLDGRLDLGVVGEALFDTALRAECCWMDTLVLIVAAGHPLAERKRVSLGDLERQPWVMREPGSSTRSVLERELEGRGFAPRVVMELGNTEAVKRSVAAGLGISFVSEHAVELEVRSGALAARPVPALNLRRGIYTVRRRASQVTPLAAGFLAGLGVADECG